MNTQILQTSALHGGEWSALGPLGSSFQLEYVLGSRIVAEVGIELRSSSR
jgi:hypothetical protein